MVPFNNPKRPSPQPEMATGGSTCQKTSLELLIPKSGPGESSTPSIEVIELSSTSSPNAPVAPLTPPQREPHTEFKPIKIHTAKCDVCNKHNKSILHRCIDCGWQICTPCWDARGGNGAHGVTRKFTGPVFCSSDEEDDTPKKTMKDVNKGSSANFSQVRRMKRTGKYGYSTPIKQSKGKDGQNSRVTLNEGGRGKGEAHSSDSTPSQPRRATGADIFTDASLSQEGRREYAGGKRGSTTSLTEERGDSKRKCSEDSISPGQAKGKVEIPKSKTARNKGKAKISSDQEYFPNSDDSIHGWDTSGTVRRAIRPRSGSYYYNVTVCRRGDNISSPHTASDETGVYGDDEEGSEEHRPDVQNEDGILMAGARAYKKRRFRNLTPESELRMNWLLIAAEEVFQDKETDVEEQTTEYEDDRMTEVGIITKTRSPLFVPMNIDSDIPSETATSPRVGKFPLRNPLYDRSPRLVELPIPRPPTFLEYPSPRTCTLKPNNVQPLFSNEQASPQPQQQSSKTPDLMDMSGESTVDDGRTTACSSRTSSSRGRAWEL